MNGRQLRARFLLLLPCLLVFSAYASAGIYEWTDADGTVHFSDAPQPETPSQQTRSNPASVAGHDGLSTIRTLSARLVQQQKAQQKALQDAEKEIEQEADQEAQQDTTQQDTQQVAQQPQVIMYSTSWCPYCKQARNYFWQHGIKFTDYDVEKDPAAAQRFRQMNGHGVPLILVGNARMDGFSPQHFEQVYNSARW